MKIRRLGRRPLPPADPTGKKRRRKRPEGLYFWAQLMAALLVVAGVIIGGLISLVRWTDHAVGSGASGGLEVVLAVPQNGPAMFSPTFPLQTRASTPQVDVTLRNNGERQVVLTQARISVEDAAWLPICISPGAGPLPVAGRYAAALPFLPRPGDRSATEPLHDQVAPGRADRFKVYFQAPQVGEETTIYALHLEIEAEAGGESVDAGRFLFAVPSSVVRNGALLPEDDALIERETFRPSDSAWCYRHNLSQLHRILTRPGDRSPELAALTDLQTARAWPGLRDRSLPPKEAIGPLLRNTAPWGPVVAVYAAEHADSPELLKETRRRAAAVLLDRAERHLAQNDWPVNALEEASASQWLMPSPAARGLIGRAQARQWESEEEVEEGNLG